MSIFQNILSAFAAIVTALYVRLLILALSLNANSHTAIDIVVVPKIAFSLRFWLLAAFFFALFFAASRIGNKVLRGILFWVPVTAISVLGLSYIAFLSYVLLQLRHG